MVRKRQALKHLPEKPTRWVTSVGDGRDKHWSTEKAEHIKDDRKRRRSRGMQMRPLADNYGPHAKKSAPTRQRFQNSGAWGVRPGDAIHWA